MIVTEVSHACPGLATPLSSKSPFLKIIWHDLIEIVPDRQVRSGKVKLSSRAIVVSTAILTVE